MQNHNRAFVKRAKVKYWTEYAYRKAFENIGKRFTEKYGPIVAAHKKIGPVLHLKRYVQPEFAE